MHEATHAQDASAPPTELSIGDALALAVEMHKHGDINQAEKVYRRILDIAPGHPDALNFLGMIEMVRGRRPEAIELIRKSLAADPSVGERYVNLGNVLLSSGRMPEALEAFERAVALVPDSATAHCNLAVVYSLDGRLDEAERALKRALELDPKHSGAYNNYGNLLASRGDIQGCLRNYIKAAKLSPNDSNIRRALGAVYTALGDIEAAIRSYREWLEHEPDHPMAQFLLNACLGENVPDRASDAFIVHAFDVFATSFDSKLAGLGYRAPELVEGAMRAAGVPAQNGLDVLDAGCGTGLCGPLVAKYAAKLHGVDLSGGMLAQARARDMYDELAQEELTQFLASRHAAYDVVLSADTLCYFGPLDAVLGAAASALRPRGWLFFTLELADPAAAPGGHRINPHGRYSHTREYVTRTLAETGFDDITVVEDVLRQEAGSPVNGLVVSARKAGRKATE
jgi:predicted TPR repeat methyltransferase